VGAALLLALLAAAASAAPAAGVTSTNACRGCHSNTYSLTVSIDTYDAPTTVGIDPSTVRVVASITGNEQDKPARDQPYFACDLTVTASSQAGLLAFTGSPTTIYTVRPELTRTFDLSVAGTATGQDTLVLTVRMRPGHYPGYTTRTISVRVPVDVTVNSAPRLKNGQVDPTAGGLDAQFNFTVRYVDAEGDPPTEVLLLLDGRSHPMSPADGRVDTPATGELFAVSLPGTTIGKGTDHMFAFSSSDGKAAAVGDVGSHSGPDVGIDHPPLCAIDYPTGGRFGVEVRVSGSSSDPDEGDFVDRVEVSVGGSAWRPANGTQPWSLVVDLSALADGPLHIAARAVCGALTSNEAAVDIIVKSGLVNEPPMLFFSLADGVRVDARARIYGTVMDPDSGGQAPTVLVGVDGPPVTPADVSVDAGGWAWSVLLDLSIQADGPFVVRAVAWDAYAASRIGLHTFVLYNPDNPPAVSMDPLPEELWGTVDVSGSATDPDGDRLTILVSVDGGDAMPAQVTGARWEALFDVTDLAEGRHLLRVLAGDGSLNASAEANFTVKVPLLPPAIRQVDPPHDIGAFVGEAQTFRVWYIDQDQKGSTVWWRLDGATIAGAQQQGASEVSLAFDSPAAHHLTVRFSNVAADWLYVEYGWNITAAAVLVVRPVGGTDVGVRVGEVAILALEVSRGAPTRVTWTADGAPAGTGPYLAYMPASPGQHQLGVVVEDAFGNLASLDFLVTASMPPGTGGGGGGGGAGQGPGAVGLAVMASMALLAAALTVRAAVRYRRARREADARRGDVVDAPPQQPAVAPGCPTCGSALVPAGAEGVRWCGTCQLYVPVQVGTGPGEGLEGGGPA
jgi:hypothetical protein